MGDRFQEDASVLAGCLEAGAIITKRVGGGEVITRLQEKESRVMF